MVMLFKPLVIGWDDDGWIYTTFYAMLPLTYIISREPVWGIFAYVLHNLLYVL